MHLNLTNNRLKIIICFLFNWNTKIPQISLPIMITEIHCD